MMGLSETLLFYLLIGMAVAAAVWLNDGDKRAQRWFRTSTAIFFWPLYLPILLSRETNVVTPAVAPLPATRDYLAEQIDEVERELDRAFAGLEGWAETALSRHREQVMELRAAWKIQAARIREMDEVLSSTTIETSPAQEPLHTYERGRRENLARLRDLRARAHDELTSTLARVLELVSLIYLAKFAGESSSRAEQLVAEIAASVESLSEVAEWRCL